jgi:hypothetical protein
MLRLPEYHVLRTITVSGKWPLVVVTMACLCITSPCLAYVDLAPTLSKVIADSKRIAIVEVVKFSRDSRVAVLKEVRALKGDISPEAIRQQVASGQGAIPRHILQWAQPGARGVLFVSGNSALVCVGQGWYQVAAPPGGAWTLGADRPDLPLAYYGAVSRLAEAVETMLAGRQAVITTVSHGDSGEGASFDLALNRASLPGLVKVQRIRADLKMPPIVMAASANRAYQVGPGPVDEADLPALLGRLKSADATARAEAAEDVGSLGRKAASAAGPLAELLNDPAVRVRFSAASALLRIAPAPAPARVVEVLGQGLADADPAVRRDAARAAGLAGPAAAGLGEKLAALLKDPEEPTRLAALQAISMLGPTAGAAAAQAVIPLLDEPALTIDAADALGRIGPAARPAMGRLAKLLSADQPAVRWAGVRAMAQIGGPDARPVVEFMIHALPTANEVDGYNMMIYLSLLGPDATEAADAVRSVRMKNMMLPTATLWAMQPDKGFPWQAGRGPFGGPGGPFGGPGGGEGPNPVLLIYECYVSELGPRLRPAAGVLARQIMDGTAGELPAWGYKILACAADDATAILSAHLSDGDIVMRERATVTLGYMGPAAAPVKAQVQAALAKAPTLREQKLIRWCLREISRAE